ncbi:MAG: type II secretion system F family protein [Desulfovibrio sp.]
MPNQLFPLLIAGLGTLAAFLLVSAALSALSTSRTGKLRQRLEAATSETPPGGAERSGGQRPGPLRGVANLLSSLGDKLGPKEEERVDQTRLALTHAGLRNPNAVLTFQGVKAGGTLLLAGTGLLVRVLALPDLALHWSIVCVALPAAVGLLGPEQWLRGRVAARQQRAAEELPDALDLLVVCVEAGMGLDQAVYRVSRELARSAPVISSELKTLTLQLRAGKPRQEALREMARRVGLDDLNSLATLLIQADIFGISVAHTLRVYSDSLRTKRQQRAEERAAKLPVKLLIPLVTCILPALFVAIMGPAGIRMADVLGKMR